MTYACPIQCRRTYTTYDQNTPYLSGQCYVAMVTGSYFKYANYIFCLKILVFLDQQNSRVQNYVYSYKIYQNTPKTVCRSIQ